MLILAKVNAYFLSVIQDYCTIAVRRYIIALLFLTASSYTPIFIDNNVPDIEFSFQSFTHVLLSELQLEKLTDRYNVGVYYISARNVW